MGDIKGGQGGLKNYPDPHMKFKGKTQLPKAGIHGKPVHETEHGEDHIACGEGQAIERMGSVHGRVVDHQGGEHFFAMQGTDYDRASSMKSEPKKMPEHRMPHKKGPHQEGK